jgi:Arc/MetJ-type ribon-helix-helix transcriptional regulator
MAEATAKAPVVLETKIPPRLAREIEALIEAGWYSNLDSVVLEALRRFADSHRTELMEAFAREDIEWGLSGRE